MVLDPGKEEAGSQESYARLDLGLLNPIHQKTVDKDTEGVFILPAGLC